MMLLPESPPYLLSRQQEQNARRSLLWLRGKNYDVDRELEDLKLAQSERESAGSVNLADLLCMREYLHPFAIVLTLMFVQQFCGVNVVTFYIQTIFAEAGSDMDPG